MTLCVLTVLSGCNLPQADDQASQPAAADATASIVATVATAAAGVATPAADATSTSEAASERPVATRTPTRAAAPVETTYTVQEGDTLSQIAEKHGTTVDALVEANNLSSSDLIYVGQALKIVRSSTEGAVADLPPTASTAPQEDVIPAPPTSTPHQPAPTELPPTSVAREARPTPVTVNGRTYDAYNYAAIKKGQWYQYTCEFDAAWVVLKTYGFDVPLEKQVEIVGLDTSIEPYYKETANGVVIYGGDVTTAYSGDYKKNFLARSSGEAMRKLFEHYDLSVTAVRDRPSLEAALLGGDLVWIKTTVDFKPWREATWIMPDGRSYKTVLGNDHALVVMGFNKDGVVVRDPLGPTSTNWNRPYEYHVTWARFMASWGAQEFDGLAVAPPGR